MARFVGKLAVAKEGEKAKIHYFSDEEKLTKEARYDGLYAVCTVLMDDEVKDILKISEGRWKIEECFRIMKTELEARPAYIRLENRIRDHFPLMP